MSKGFKKLPDWLLTFSASCSSDKVGWHNLSYSKRENFRRTSAFFGSKDDMFLNDELDDVVDDDEDDDDEKLRNNKCGNLLSTIRDSNNIVEPH